MFGKAILIDLICMFDLLLFVILCLIIWALYLCWVACLRCGLLGCMFGFTCEFLDFRFICGDLFAVVGLLLGFVLGVLISFWV